MSGDGPSLARKAARNWARLEDGVLVLALALLAAIPALERLLHRFAGGGISAAGELGQHLCLILAMAGGAVAARQRKLLAITTLVELLPGKIQPWIRGFSHAAGAAVAGLLAAFSLEFALFERGAGPESNLIAYGIQKWAVQLCMPAGFALIALRLVRNAAEGWPARLGTLAGALLLCAPLLLWPDSPDSPQRPFLPLLLLLGLATLLGAPLFAFLGGAALLLLWADFTPLADVANNFYSLSTESFLPTLPLFTLAGYVLAESRASQRLLAVFQALAGRSRAGPPLATVLVCSFFTAFTGGSGVAILALAPLLLPMLLSARCSERNSLGLLAGSGSLGILLPPSLPVILYFIVAGSGKAQGPGLGQLFLGGLLPCLLLMGLLALWGAWRIPPAQASAGDGPSLLAAARGAVWELLLPVVAIVSLFGGLFGTPVAAAAATALYSVLATTLIRGDLSLARDIPRILVKCGLLVGGVLLILGVSKAFTHCLTLAQIPDLLVEWITARVDSPWVFLLALNLFLILAGCLMDIFSAIVVIVPLLVPLGAEFGIDPVHLAVIFLVNLEIGYLTPPIGLNLYLAAYRFDRPVMEIARAALPVLGALLIGLLLVTYLPFLSTWLPGLLD